MQLSDFESRANDMVVHSGALRGLSQEDIKRVGEHLIFQNGCKNVLQEILGSENLHADVHILSYCWSGDLIRSAFSSGILVSAHCLIMHFIEFYIFRLGIIS